MPTISALVSQSGQQINTCAALKEAVNWRLLQLQRAGPLCAACASCKLYIQCTLFTKLEHLSAYTRSVGLPLHPSESCRVPRGQSSGFEERMRLTPASIRPKRGAVYFNVNSQPSALLQRMHATVSESRSDVYRLDATQRVGQLSPLQQYWTKRVKP